jgi:3alpha(or 20beta)-hydroxysteroid dehydrogenase
LPIRGLQANALAAGWVLYIGLPPAIGSSEGRLEDRIKEVVSEMARLEGKVALITGAARGQGEAGARLFVEEGAKVVLGDVLDEPGKAVAESLGDAARYVHHDVTIPESWRETVALATDTFGRLDVLVNNAGVLIGGSLREMSLDDYMKVVQVNQVGVFLGMQAVIPALEAAGGGSIINISSVGGMVGVGGASAYVATKFAVRGMTKCAALELGPLGIRVNSVHPGGVDTAMVAPDVTAELSPDASRGASSDIYRQSPLGRISQPIEMARLVAFLASDESSYCTGSEFIADGGLLAGI